MPIGVTIAGFVMTVLSWYSMVRTGLQTMHDDLEARKRVDEDIKDMYTDVEHQEKNLDRWKRKWYICESTPDEVLLQFWDGEATNTIKEKLTRIQKDLIKVRKTLDKVRNLGKRLRITVFIALYKKPTQELIKRYFENMSTIERESEAGWNSQRIKLLRQIGDVNQRDIPVSYSLIRIAMQIMTDAEALRASCQNVQHDIAVLLDLDLFHSSALEEIFPNIERVTRVHGAGHLKLELLLREADRLQDELTRVVVERAPDGVSTESRDIDAFRAILGPGMGDAHRHHFSVNSLRAFRMSKIPRTGHLCSRLHMTFDEALASHNAPIYDVHTQHSADLVLGEVSNSRAAFELAQSCLLFLRISWIASICRCRLKVGLVPDSEQQMYHFGLDMTMTAHHAPRWHNPLDHGQEFKGELEHSWCTLDTFNWSSLNKPIRYLGLLLVELAIGAAVFPAVDSTTEGAAKVTGIFVLKPANTDPQTCSWQEITLRDILKLVKGSFNDIDGIAKAVEHCLTVSFPPAPSDAEWETHLKRFYFKVVKP